MTLPSAAEKAVVVEAMFDRIAPHYDRMNRLMTFGLDQRWRRVVLDRLRIGPGETVLDLACGTGDFAGLCRERGAHVIATDYAAGMLGRAAARGFRGILVRGDAMSLPFADGAFDAIVCGFALRNFAHLPPAFAEMARTLRAGGRIGLLEVDRPTNGLVRLGHSLYFDRVVPLLGRALADRDAYRYLPESTSYLPAWPRMKAMIEEAGFADVRHQNAMFGAVQVITGVRSLG